MWPEGSRHEVALVVFLIVLGIEAVEDSPTEGKDGASPGQAVAPVKFMVDPEVDTLDELDRVEDQTAGLEYNWMRYTDFSKILRMHVKLKINWN